MAGNYEQLLASPAADPVAESERSGSVATDPRFPLLRSDIRDAGLLDSRRRHYLIKISVNLALLTACWTAFAALGPSWWQLALAPALAFCFVQIGLVGHDIGHRQLTRDRRTMDVLGYLHWNLLLGASFDWWVNHHDRHHSEPNHLDRDPDIVRRKAIFAAEQAARPMSAARRVIIRYQDKIFFPMAALESLGLRVLSIRAIASGSVRRPWTEGALLGLHLAGYLTAVFLVLRPGQAVAFIVVHHLVTGLYSGSIFAPNHKGMPVRSDAERLDWMTRQVVTARNIRGGRIVDYLYGGLNYQIEHHLFPSMPQPNLRLARPVVRAHCRAAGLDYYETSVVRAYAEIRTHLWRVSRQARARD
ncbi:acyl-CoA desaturase [Nocardia sp. CDC159]|uniref:Acyl-CoA desaturase n=1 Tax=Nocardia pulmonis TaxID=2951408 RepID=A0A9X2IZX5_9NOCA|nr:MULTISPECIES: acyl-CoA desaturase [Nocardia]MCM6777129.1 acyl-CoA desaturase [Nocardia pulmonis]MCM6790014.1 acyl-CoA desaturase [Nocardia sp. CDC159]